MFCLRLDVIFIISLKMLTELAYSLVTEATISECQLMDSIWRDSLRKELVSDNCLSEVETVSPQEIQRAMRLFHRDGFVVVKDALAPSQVKRVRSACEDVADRMLKRDPLRLGNRGPYRYSFATASNTGHVLHIPEFAELVDLPTITPILKAIFGDDRYICRGARGDFNLPGAVYQALHSDTWPTFGFVDSAPTVWPDSGRLNYRDLPVFYIAVNFVVTNITALNAPIRQIPMTQNSQRPIPSLEDEPLWMKRSTVCPAAPGSVIIRDVRAWHGGTPNLSDEMRCLPNIEYYASWYRFDGSQTGSTPNMPISMPREIYSTLSPFAQELCREIVAAPGQTLDTEMPENIVILQSDVLNCYKRMGLTDEDIERYEKMGKFFNYKKDSKLQFYLRKTISNINVDDTEGKDEL